MPIITSLTCIQNIRKRYLFKKILQSKILKNKHKILLQKINRTIKAVGIEK